MTEANTHASTVEMTDLVFPLSGEFLPHDFTFSLWRAIVQALPALETTPGAGMLPLRAPGQAHDLLLSRRSRLALRVPLAMLEQAMRLAGAELEADGHAITLGSPKGREMQPYPTLHAQLVNSELDEGTFLETMEAEIRSRGIEGKLICGKRVVMPGSDGRLAGYSLVVHELKPDASLHLQWVGVGSERRYGCGMFIPYKVIANLDGQTG